MCSTGRSRAVQAEGMPMQSSSMGGAGAFQSLAGYIFGRNGDSEKMAMTTPVLSGGPDEAMSFVLPSRYWAAEEEGGATPPEPLDEQVVLERRGGGVLTTSDVLACLWFGGFAGSGTVEAQRAALLEQVRADPEWELADEDAVPLLLQYNDPFTCVAEYSNASPGSVTHRPALSIPLCVVLIGLRGSDGARWQCPFAGKQQLRALALIDAHVTRADLCKTIYKAHGKRCLHHSL